VIAEAWALKEAFRALYKAADRREAELRLDHFLAATQRAQLPAFTAFADGIRLWRNELLAYFALIHRSGGGVRPVRKEE